MHSSRCACEINVRNQNSLYVEASHHSPLPVIMKRLLIFTAIVLCAGLSSCQCAEKPDIGPVEGDDEQSRLVSPHAETKIHPA